MLNMYRVDSARTSSNQICDVIVLKGKMRPLFTLPLPKVLINSLNNAGFFSFEDLFTENGALSEIAATVLKDQGFTLDSVISLCKIPHVVSASVKLRDEEIKENIPTFCEALDNILNGGIPLDSLLQVCGPPGSGKTLLALQLCLSVQIPICLGGLEAQAVFIDTDSGFSVSRFREIAEGAYKHCYKVANFHNLLEQMGNFSTDTVAENLHYISTRDHVELQAAVQLLKKFITNHSKIKVIIVDSFTHPFLILSNLLERTRIIYSVLNQLSALAHEFNLAVIITNHLTTKINKNLRCLVPSLGESFSHRIPQTLLLGKVNDRFSAMLTKSPYLPQTQAHFNITKDGLRDI